MPSLIIKSGKRRYRGCVVVKGRRKEKLFPDGSKASMRAAAAWEAETKKTMKRQLADCDPSEWVFKGPTVSRWAAEYLKYSRAIHSKNVFEDKARTFRLLFQAIPPKAPVSELTKTQALEFLRARADATTNKRANAYRKHLCAAWNFGSDFVKDFPEGKNPFQAVKRFPEIKTPRYVPSMADFWKVVDATETLQDRVMLLTFIYTGARRGEVFRLTWGDIDFKDETIILRTRKRTGGEEFDFIPMVESLRAALLNWWETTPKKATSEPVFIITEKIRNFPNYQTGDPYKKRPKFMHRMCQRAGVKPFGFHSIRHLAATALYHAGVETAVIQAVLRHKSATTTNIYLRRLGLTGIRAGLEKIERPGTVIPFRREK